jgi:alkanesulfonate monooxygenase SsuD/methylene tetrahydromethanopterin reductase-like flavin-dependent oxidoreductase (luciferase family)
VQQPRIPFAIASIQDRGMRLAARYGSTWVTTGNRAAHDGPVPAGEGAAMVRDQMARVDAACEAEGRDPATLDRLVLLGAELDDGMTSRAAFDEVVGAYAAVGVTDIVVPWPRRTDPYKGDPAVLDDLLS